MVHGIGEHVGRYSHVAEYFMQQGYAVTGIDHYGHGKSDGRRGASRGMAFTFDYLQAFVAHVKDLYGKPVLMYGHSMGGGILTGFLLQRQPQLLAAVISAPALIIGMRPGPLLKGLLRVLSALAPNLLIKQGLDINKISHDPDAVQLFLRDPLRHDKLSLRLANDMIRNGAWCLEHAQALTTRSLLIHGDADAFTALEGSRLFVRRAPATLLTYKEWPGSYHELHNEYNKDEVLQFICQWLRHLK